MGGVPTPDVPLRCALPLQGKHSSDPPLRQPRDLGEACQLVTGPVLRGLAVQQGRKPLRLLHAAAHVLQHRGPHSPRTHTSTMSETRLDVLMLASRDHIIAGRPHPARAAKDHRRRDPTPPIGERTPRVQASGSAERHAMSSLGVRSKAKIDYHHCPVVAQPQPKRTWGFVVGR